ncbi:MAG: sigma-54-dependent Fis family transcriptional regulator [Ignavibacteriae bacterium]|nr:sigma-54-dependent Fis family transcriptional regulator [Ignavibacteriota bacterium]
MGKILIVDDEQNIIDVLSLVLTSEKHSVDTCLEGFTAIEKVRNNKYDLVLLDIKMPRMDGLEVLEKILEIDKSLIIIMISGHGNFETAVEATKKGAYNYIQKPPDLDELKIAIKNAIEFKRSKDEIEELKNELIESNKIIGISTSIKDIQEKIKKYSDLDLNVLIYGESGTGKMLVAKQLQLNSTRSDKPFIVANCANLSDEKADEELFGIFENGKLVRNGLLADAKGGFFLFDEISSLSLEVQSKILKVIEENKFTRSGQKEEIILDTRFIFTTNKNLEVEISDGRFREDLYHRINVLLITIPPLRERTEDIDEFIHYFTAQICRAYNLNKKEFSEKAIRHLRSFRWPGNVRELKNTIERLIFDIDRIVIEDEDIDIPGSRHSKEINDLLNKNLTLNEFQNESEKLFLLKMLKDYKYNIVHTAEALKIQRSHLYKLLSKYNIPTPSKIK